MWGDYFGLGLPIVGLGLPIVGLGLPIVELGLPIVGLGLPKVELGLPTVRIEEYKCYIMFLFIYWQYSEYTILKQSSSYRVSHLFPL